MPLHEERSVRIDGGLVVWDGVTRPETMDEGGQKYTLKVVIPPTSPDLPILDGLARQCLVESEFKGHLPNGGLWAIGQAGPQEFGGGFGGWAVVNGITYRPPEVYDENGQVLQPMQFGQLLYPGQTVDVLVSCKAYNNKSKGIKCQLEGLRIVASANSPRLQIGSGASAASAFGGGQPPAQSYQPPAQGNQSYQPPGGQPPAQGYQPPAQSYQPPAQGYQPPGGQPPARGYQPPGGQPPAQGYQPPAQSYQPPAQGNQGYQPPGGQPPAQGYQPPGGQPPAQGYPSQAHDFLPGGQH